MAGAPTWQPQTFASIDEPTRYEAVRVEIEAGRSTMAWRSTSRCGASGMLVPLDDVDLSRTPLLHWSWRVDKGLEIENERQKAGDDFAARVYVLFRFDPDHAELGELLTHRLLERLGGTTLPGQSLCYVWASHVPPGTAWTHPSHSSVWMSSLRSGSGRRGEGDGWHHEIVDVVADQRRAFGAEATPRTMAVAIMTDTDTTCSSASALFANLRFTPRKAVDTDESDPRAVNPEIGATPNVGDP